MGISEFIDEFLDSIFELFDGDQVPDQVPDQMRGAPVLSREPTVVEGSRKGVLRDVPGQATVELSLAKVRGGLKLAGKEKKSFPDYDGFRSALKKYWPNNDMVNLLDEIRHRMNRLAIVSVSRIPENFQSDDAEKMARALTISWTSKTYKGLGLPWPDRIITVSSKSIKKSVIPAGKYLIIPCGWARNGSGPSSTYQTSKEQANFGADDIGDVYDDLKDESLKLGYRTCRAYAYATGAEIVNLSDGGVARVKPVNNVIVYRSKLHQTKGQKVTSGAANWVAEKWNAIF